MQQETAGVPEPAGPSNDDPLGTTSPSPDRQILQSDLVDHVARESKVFFKSQQINDPELTADEKVAIVRDVLAKSHTTFLARFGQFIKEDHLRFFEQDGQTSGYSPDESYEVGYYLERIRRSHNGGRHREVRNRRYAALKQLVQEGKYFSETEMMQREPLLYDQLVGQYLTEREKKARDAVGQKNDSLVAILFNGMDREKADSLRQEQEQAEKRDDEAAGGGDGDDVGFRDMPPGSPAFSRAQWGNFDDEEVERQRKVENDRASRKRNKKFSTPLAALTAGERDLLRDEFVGTMYSRFIAGEDVEFDYSKVDESMELDNLDIVEQDEQERYFDTDDGETEQVKADEGCKMQQDDESEDDLDVYMRHLEKHLDNQRNIEQMSCRMREVNCEYESDDE
uniref:Putative coiled-coil domain protein n=1 Tax=Culex tarsalis TaxID=7177 RepID=A0A1Q3FDD1_CULTA